LGLPLCSLKGPLNQEQPTSDVTGGCHMLNPEQLRDVAQQLRDKLLGLAKEKQERKWSLQKQRAAAAKAT
jgi:hypothetical protein